MTNYGFYSFLTWLLLCRSGVNSIRTPFGLHGKVLLGNPPPQSQDISEEWIPMPWISEKFNFGQISGVSVDPDDNIYLFHRADRVWDRYSFINDTIYTGREKGPIKEATILTFNNDGKLLKSLGQNMFYLPHGITVDNNYNIWITDVALHQVLKLAPNSNKVLLQLGEKFTPGSDAKHFCKPTSVAVISNGDFFVSDGYCNSRILKFDSEGNKILQWGRNTEGFMKPGPYQLQVPHALTVVEEKGLLCTADRENGRILCYALKDGSFAYEFSSPLMGGRLFSVTYSSILGGRFFVVNGQSLSPRIPVQGFVLSTEGRVLGSFGSEFKNPHDIATSSNGSCVYVVEIGPNRAWKFVYNKPEVSYSQIMNNPEVSSKELLPPGIHKKSDDTEGLTGAILVVISCFIFGLGMCVALLFYSKSKKSSNPDTKRLLSNIDY